MKKADKPNYFIVKHDLVSLCALPGFIWRGYDQRPPSIPRMFGNVRKGDRWIAFAYIKDEDERKACAQVTGIYQCTAEADHGTIPRHCRTRHWERGWLGTAWTIRGKKYGPQPDFGPVSIPPIDTILGRNVQKRGTIIRLRNAREFDAIRREIKKRAFDSTDVPALEREPRNEQEVLAVVAHGHRQIGINKILRIRTGFPDMLVRIGNREVHIELEYNSVSFKAHLPDLRKIRGQHRKLLAKIKDRRDRRSVAVLCWLDGDKQHKLTKQVRGLRIFELQTLLRERQKIRL
jgi:hypothetical protein